MTPELAAQKAKIEALYGQLRLLTSKRARKSKAYVDLTKQIKAEVERYDAMVVALDLTRE